MIQSVDISLLNSCNFSCDYCVSSAYSVRCNNESANTYDISGPVLDYGKLVSYVRTHLDGWILHLTGGEPFTLPGLEYLVRDLVKTNKVVIATNGSLLSNHKSILDLPKDQLFIRMSLHPDQRELEQFDLDIQPLIESGTKYVINYMLHPRHLKSGKFMDYIGHLMLNKYNYEVTTFQGTYLGKYFHPSDPVYNDVREFFTVVDEPMEMLTVKPNGLVYSCHGTSSGTPIGDVYASTLDMSKACKMKCYAEACGGISFCQTYDAIRRIVSDW